MLGQAIIDTECLGSEFSYNFRDNKLPLTAWIVNSNMAVENTKTKLDQIS
jgi:hypothetical protein